jgi:hypothetical protein
MTGTQLFTLVGVLVPGFDLDTTTFYQLLNALRIRIEFMRPWMKLRTYDYSQSLAAQSYSQIFPPVAKVKIPDATSTFNVPFLYLSRDGEITLYNNANQYEIYTEIPLNLAIPQLSQNNVFYVDHAQGYIFFLGTISTTYQVFIPYQGNWGDITATTQWLNIPTEFHPLLAYIMAQIYREGVSYDDINALNAIGNSKEASLIYSAMVNWDDALQRSSTTRMNLPISADVPGANFQRRISMGGE